MTGIRSRTWAMRALAVCTATTVLAACGGGGSGGGTDATSEATPTSAATTQDPETPASTPGDARAEIEATVRGYYNALADSDAAAACSLLSEEAISTMETTDYVWKGSCEASIEASFAVIPAAQKEKLRSAKITSVEIQGDTATVTAEGAERPIPVKKTERGWVIADFRM